MKNAFLAIEDNFRDYRVLYLSYDVTEQIHKGANVVGGLLGEGLYNALSHWITPFGRNAFYCQIEITYKDGSKEWVCTDESWKTKASAIVMNGVYAGEIYDANQETNDWCLPSCDDSAWKNAILIEPPTGRLTAQTAPSDKITETLVPVSFEQQTDGTYIVDFGKEISGWIRFKGVSGTKGDTLTVDYMCESPLGVQKYVFKGEGKESYAPRFTWYVFRRAVIKGATDLSANNLQAEAVNTDVRLSATFETSNLLFNQINEIWQRSEIDNLHGGIQSDCPHRERNPYLGDGQVSCVTVMNNFDAAAFFQKWIRDMRDTQDKETGYVPNSAPWQSACGGGVAWGAAMNIIPWEYYVHYGDKQVLKESYWAMKEQVRYMTSWLTPEGTMLSVRCNVNTDKPNYWFNLGEWVAPYEQLPKEELIHTFYLWYCADINAKAAKALGLSDDVCYYTDLADKVKQAFHRKFYDRSLKSYGDYGSNIFALVMGVSAEDYVDVLHSWKQEIEKNNGHVNTGIFGTRYFFETLAACGLNELAYEAMNKTDFPSFGYMIANGATTTWEQWNGQNSRNHPMFGGGLTWFYKYLAGVQVDEDHPGYEHFFVKPVLVKNLTHIRYTYLTPYGKIVSEINQIENEVTLHLTVPVGASATLFLPISGKQIDVKQGTYSYTERKDTPPQMADRI